MGESGAGEIALEAVVGEVEIVLVVPEEEGVSS